MPHGHKLKIEIKLGGLGHTAVHASLKRKHGLRKNYYGISYEFLSNFTMHLENLMININENGKKLK